MIKKLLFVFSILMVAFGAFGQVDFDKYSDTIILEDGVAHKAEITLTNNSGHDIELSWKVLENTLHDVLPPATDNSNVWELQFCECNTCYTNDFGPLTSSGGCNSPLGSGPNNTQKWYLTAKPNGQNYGNAVWEIEVTNKTDLLKDTLSFFVMNPDSTNDPYNPHVPNSVNEMSYNAVVNSYPNPANNEFVVNYALTNVRAPILSIYNVVGSKVASFQINGLNGRLDVSTSSLENGMYFYTIEEAGQRIFIQKFSVVH